MTDGAENEDKEEDGDDAEETNGNPISPASPLTPQNQPIFTISSPMSNSTSMNYPSPFEPPPDYDSWSATPSTSCSYCSSSNTAASTTQFSRNRRSCCYYYPGPPPPPRWDIIPENVEQNTHQSQLGNGTRDIRWVRVSKNSFVIKRWALILLILVMLIMVSLLFGITLQHVQLLRSVAHLHKDERSQSIQAITESSVLKHRPIHHSFGRNTYSEKDWK
ncbi:unnamed protein product [Lepeophtheirus salmonis]|uniref:(salmon louse) hypothetical protein n=2 Tax=Lepeophtheirus salmonis TaxID=72036 RepID=A0A7R8CS30_LEPSM|nr:uncharacterized protein LOC121116511 isoform X2 [Lepeophtheirus salmonis]CAB4062883.1 unnamed protein product [Lepeophtheirus salmonis]CAF2913030.1 unnamed protein product [Lepeophtheirus salmonis]